MTNLEDKDFNKNLLDKIKEAKILPKPKWQFLLKNSIIWGLGIIALILGAISTSLVFYMITGEDIALGRNGINIFESLLFVIPFFWLICLAIFAYAVFYYVKHTKKGYKYSAKTIILGIFIISLLFGGVLSALGVGQIIDDILGERAPMYDKFINPRLDYWSNPEDGRLTGMIVSFEKPVTYYLIDRGGETWVTKVTDGDDTSRIIVGRPVRLLGKKVGDHSFVIKEVLSVGPGREFFKRSLPPGIPLPNFCDDKPCQNLNEAPNKHENINQDKIKNNLEKPNNIIIRN